MKKLKLKQNQLEISLVFYTINQGTIMKNEFDEIAAKIPFIQAYAMPMKEKDEEGDIPYHITVSVNPNNSYNDIVAMLGKLCMNDPIMYFNAMCDIALNYHKIFHKSLGGNNAKDV